jgi:hypothetical protein
MLGNALSALRSLRTALTNLTESLGELLSSFGSMGSSSEQAFHRATTMEQMDQLAAEQLEMLRRHDMKKTEDKAHIPISQGKADAVVISAERLRSAVESYILRPTGHNHSAVQSYLFEYQALWIEAKV